MSHLPVVQKPNEVRCHPLEQNPVSSLTIHSIRGSNKELHQLILKPRRRWSQTKAAIRIPLRRPPGSQARYLQEVIIPEPAYFELTRWTTTSLRWSSWFRTSLNPSRVNHGRGIRNRSHMIPLISEWRIIAPFMIALDIRLLNARLSASTSKI